MSAGCVRLLLKEDNECSFHKKEHFRRVRKIVKSDNYLQHACMSVLSSLLLPH